MIDKIPAHADGLPDETKPGEQMSPRKSDARDRMLSSATTMLRERGATATSIDRVLAESGAPRGSVYHHFPGGRTQLIQEAVSQAGDRMTNAIEHAAANDDPVEAVDAYFAAWRDRLVESDYRLGCPIVAVAVETNDDAPELSRTAGEVFARWQDSFTAMFRRHGLPEHRARRLASLVVAAEEGAVIVCRAQRSPVPMDEAAAAIRELLTHTFSQHPDRD